MTKTPHKKTGRAVAKPAAKDVVRLKGRIGLGPAKVGGGTLLTGPRSSRDEWKFSKRLAYSNPLQPESERADREKLRGWLKKGGRPRKYVPRLLDAPGPSKRAKRHFRKKASAPGQRKHFKELAEAMASPDMQRAFRERSLHALERISRAVPAASMAAALAAPTDAGALARILAEATVADLATRELDPFAAAFARNAQHREELVALSHGLLTAPQAGKLLGITRQAIDKRRRNRRLLAVKVAGDWRYPAFQFDPKLPADAFAAMIEALDDASGWSALDFLLTPDSALEDRTPVGALALGGDAAEAALRLARAERGDGYS